jgi:hypothetical protein
MFACENCPDCDVALPIEWLHVVAGFTKREALELMSSGGAS